MSLDEFCSGELCERAFDLIAVGAPSIIALFLIIYAHKTLSARLKEASDAGHRNNSRIYRTLLYSVWSVALVLLVTHAGVFVLTQFRPDPAGGQGVIQGAFRDFESNREVDLESRPERLYMRTEAGGNNWHWIIRGTPPLERETFKIVSEGTALLCPIDLTTLPEGAPDLVELKLDQKNGQLRPSFSLLLLPRENNINWPCEIQVDGEPPEQPANGAPMNAFDALSLDEPGAGTGAEHSWLELMFGGGRAFAAEAVSDFDRIVSALNDDRYRTRLAARKAIARDFEPYREWTEEVARAEADYRAGRSKYGRPSYRVRLGLVYALSRRHPLPREEMFAPVDLSEAVVAFALEQALSDDKHLRASAKRFAISYPGDDMIRRLGELWAREQATAGDRRTRARDLLAHFYYNRGVLIVLARRDGLAGAPEPAAALSALARAAELARGLPEEWRLEYAKISYGIGWSHVVGANEGFGPAFTESQAQAAFEDTLVQVEGREKEYPYEWQIPVIEEYLRTRDYALFNK